jgi:hypothetical protein
MKANSGEKTQQALHIILVLAAVLMGSLISYASSITDSASAITYKVNESVKGNANVPSYTQTGTIVGTIKTDGKIGVLAASDILDWKLTLSDAGKSITLTGPLSGNNSAVNFLGSDLSATATQLLFNFKGADGGLLGIQNKKLLFSGEQYVCYATNQGDCDAGLSIVPTDVEGTSPWANGVPKTNVIATAGPTTPEDLVETAVTLSESTILIGSKLTLTDTVKNEGKSAAGTSATHYFLSATKTKTSASRVLSGSRAVPGLKAGASSTGKATVTVPLTTPSGTYYVLACDTTCLAAKAQLIVHVGPELVETAMSNAVSQVVVGKRFVVEDTVKNQGDTAAGPSVTRFYLSTTATKTAASHLLGANNVPSLMPDAISNWFGPMTIPVATAHGSYYTLACANDTGVVKEEVKVKNCIAAKTKLEVFVGPELVETAVSASVSSVAQGKTFVIDDTVKNQGDLDAGASVTRYYLSAKPLKSAASHLLGAVRQVPLLDPGKTSAGSVKVTVPKTIATGTYYVLACADDTGKVTEDVKVTGCRATAKTITVSKAAGAPSVVLNTPQAGATELSGFAYNIDSDENKIVVYGLTDQWHIQPKLSAPFSSIDPDGYWISPTGTWERLVVLVVDPAHYTPAASRITHPALDPGVIAWTQYPQGPVTVDFSGRTWGIHITGDAPGDASDPGPNFWSGDPSVVNVAPDGLHLKIDRIGDHWQSAEIYLMDSLGYGTYTVRVSSPLDRLDRNTVASPLSIQASPLGQAASAELGNEYLGAAQASDPENARSFVEADAGHPAQGDSSRYVQPPTGRFTSQIEWRADHITFRVWDGWSNHPAPGDMIQEWTYTGKDVPLLGQSLGQDRVHINLWLRNGNAPLNGVGDEMVIHSFTFEP